MRISLLIFVGLVLLPGLSCDLCGNRISREIRSPDGANRAVIFERDCGATTDFSTQVSILPARKWLANENGNVFIADGKHGAVSVNSQGVMDVDVVWKNNQQIEITYPPQARIFRQVSEFHGIRVSYKPN